MGSSPDAEDVGRTDNAATARPSLGSPVIRPDAGVRAWLGVAPTAVAGGPRVDPTTARPRIRPGPSPHAVAAAPPTNGTLMHADLVRRDGLIRRFA
jgi:hypothetical protein